MTTPFTLINQLHPPAPLNPLPCLSTRDNNDNNRTALADTPRPRGPRITNKVSSRGQLGVANFSTQSGAEILAQSATDEDNRKWYFDERKV